MTILKTVSIFSRLTDEQAVQIERGAIRRKVKKNVIVINEGDESDSMYIITSGRVKVFLNDENGKEIVVNDMGEGDHFGEYAMLDGSERSASIITTEPCEFLVFSKGTIIKTFRDNPDTAFDLIKDLVSRVRELTFTVKNLALMDVYGRVANTLLSFASEQDGVLITEIRLTQQEIANRVGASREMVARIMKDLEVGGYISKKGKHIIINETLPEGY
jgi:CRP/FNR family cyclic AMP-dependent transcriptional regulator